MGGIYLSLAAVTPEVANVLAANPSAVNLTLVGNGPIPDAVLRTLLRSRLNLTLRDVEELNAGTDPHRGRRIGRHDISSGGVGIRDIKSTEPEEAGLGAARGNACQEPPGSIFLASRRSRRRPPRRWAASRTENSGVPRKEEIRPSGDLNFPSLEELSPETARLLLKKRWLSISLPALQDVSLETVRLMARQTSRLNLGIPALPPEFADAFAETPTDATMGGGYILFPCLNDLPPKQPGFW